jgi:flagellar hook protein FlgE
MSIFGALNSSVTGLQAQSDALGVISDNISNVNTTGYKANKTNFAQLVTSAPTETSYNPGGVQFRPSQEIGKQGILNSSDISTDLAIEGNGMFAVKDGAGVAGQEEQERQQIIDAEPVKYTRTGNFRVNQNGLLENQNGFLLQGWRLTEDANGNLTPPADQDTLGSLETVEVNNFSGIARATENLSIGAQLPPNLPQSESRSLNARIFDAEGTAHNVRFDFTRDNGAGTALGANQYRVDVSAPRLADGTESPQSGLFNLASVAGSSAIDFGAGGDDVLDVGTDVPTELGTATTTTSDTTLDYDGDGAPDSTATVYQGLSNTNASIRIVDTSGTGGGTPVDTTQGNVIQINPDGGGDFDKNDIITFADSDGPAAGTDFDFSSRLSTVVQFDGQGGIEQLGSSGLNSNLTGNGVAGLTTVQADSEGEFNLPISFSNSIDSTGGAEIPGGTDATEPQDIALNLGTPRDVDQSGNGSIESDEEDVNDRALDGLTNFDNDEGFDVRKLEQDGLQFGNFTGVDVDEGGTVTATFSNGERRDVFQIPVVTFNNPNGLEGESGTVFSETPESGEAQLGEAGVGGAGSVAPGALEDSTVELSTEFTNMIETQRAYSASTRVVTTSDEMLQEIVNATR